MSLMECAISVKNCTPCWRWSSLCLTACSPVNTVKARSSPCWICWMSWCHLPLRHCRGSFRCLRSRFVWLCLRPCCLLDDLMPSKSKPRASWARRRSLCWRGHGCVGPCLVQRASTCCKAFTLLGEQSPLTFWLPGIKPSAPVVLWKIGIALSGLIWRLIANSRLVCSPCSPFGIITGLLLVVLMRVFLPYNGRNLPRPLTIGWLLWAMLLSLPDCSQVSHGFEPCLKSPDSLPVLHRLLLSLLAATHQGGQYEWMGYPLAFLASPAARHQGGQQKRRDPLPLLAARHQSGQHEWRDALERTLLLRATLLFSYSFTNRTSDGCSHKMLLFSVPIQ